VIISKGKGSWEEKVREERREEERDRG